MMLAAKGTGHLYNTANDQANTTPKTKTVIT